MTQAIARRIIMGVLGTAVGAITVVLFANMVQVAPAQLSGVIGIIAILWLLWIFLASLSPFSGRYGGLRRELFLAQTLDREVSRALRYGAPLIVALLHRRGLRIAKTRALLRQSDIVINARHHYQIVILTETDNLYGTQVVERLTEQLRLKSTAYADATILRAISALAGTAKRNEGAGWGYQTQALLHGLELGMYRARVRRTATSLPVYQIGEGDLLTAVDPHQVRLIDAFIDRAA